MWVTGAQTVLIQDTLFFSQIGLVRRQCENELLNRCVHIQIQGIEASVSEAALNTTSSTESDLLLRPGASTPDNPSLHPLSNDNSISDSFCRSSSLLTGVGRHALMIFLLLRAEGRFV